MFLLPPLGGAGVRTDERAPRRPCPCGFDWADRCRIFPWPGGTGCAAVHRQHFPLHPGWIRGQDCWRLFLQMWTTLLLTFWFVFRRCLPCWVVSPLLWVISQLWPLTWVPCRRELRQPRRVQSHLCRYTTVILFACRTPHFLFQCWCDIQTVWFLFRPSMCLLMTWLILLPPPLSLTWTPPPCCLVLLLSWVSTPLWIHWTPLPVSWTPTLSDLSIMT